MLHRWGFSYTRPTYRLENADAERQERFQWELENVKKLSEDMILLYEDETHIRDSQAFHATWNPIGKQKKILTRGHQAKVSLFGAVNALTGKLFLRGSAFP